jgi:NADH-quinone oxidoreductase subunit A
MLVGLIYLINYLDLIIYFVLALGLIMLLILITRLVSPRNFDFEKLSAYECGFETFITTRIKFNISFISLAILYLIFDIELVLLIPWVLCHNSLPFFSFIVICFFMFLILFGFMYEWLSGSLDWEL